MSGPLPLIVETCENIKLKVNPSGPDPGWREN